MKQKAKIRNYEGTFRARATKKAQTPDVPHPSSHRRETQSFFSPVQREETIGDVVPAKKRSQLHGGRALLLIAAFKFVKGAVLLALAFGALSLLHKDVASEVEHWLDQLRIDADNKFIGALLSKLQLVHSKELKELSALGAAYAGLFLTEGTGLLFRKRWAEWLTIIATSSLMPIEVYELVEKFTAVRLFALLVNAAVVLYLIYLVRQKEN
jgi:uncharacterized membrane protein (DUF2068 family)